MSPSAVGSKSHNELFLEQASEFVRQGRQVIPIIPILPVATDQKFPRVTCGRAVPIPVDAIERFIQQNTAAAGEERK
jgi:hypothetical protein